MHQIDLHISARCQGWQEEVAQLTKQLQHSRLRVTQLQKQLLAKSAKVSSVLPWIQHYMFLETLW